MAGADDERRGADLSPAAVALKRNASGVAVSRRRATALARLGKLGNSWALLKTPEVGSWKAAIHPSGAITGIDSRIQGASGGAHSAVKEPLGVGTLALGQEKLMDCQA